jgi:hypothetical protein
MKKMPADRGASLLSRAMIDPDAFKTLMTPITNESSANAMHVLLEPYVLASPSTIYNTYEQQNRREQRKQ